MHRQVDLSLGDDLQPEETPVISLVLAVVFLSLYRCNDCLSK